MTQKQALKIMKSGENVFLTGAAGSGKTYVLNRFIEHAREQRLEVAVTASTGIAATHMQGMTIHSWSGIGIRSSLSPAELKKMKSNHHLSRRYEKTDVLIIDEISMISAQMLDLLNQAAKQIRESDKSFGGMQVIFCGDFFQLPPISKEGEAGFAFEAQAWTLAYPQICYLEKNYRQDDNDLLDILTAIRTKNVDEYVIRRLERRQGAVLDECYRPTKLFTHNVDVDRMNQQHLDRIDEKPRTMYMQADGQKRFIVSLQKGCLAPEELEVKVGAVVMFVKNNFQQGYVNGTLGEVVDFSDEGYPIVQTKEGDEITAYPETWVIDDGEDVLAQVTQVPLRLAWAITVHKSQGMSLDAAEMDLSKCFLPGMGYVALSRVRALDGLSLKGMNETALRVDEKIVAFDQKIKT